jgi:hypothetical protein
MSHSICATFYAKFSEDTLLGICAEKIFPRGKKRKIKGVQFALLQFHSVFPLI